MVFQGKRRPHRGGNAKSLDGFVRQQVKKRDVPSRRGYMLETETSMCLEPEGIFVGQM